MITRSVAYGRSHAAPEPPVHEWAEAHVDAVLREVDAFHAQDVPAYGRIRRWGRINEAEGRYVRVILLPDGETVHNAFFDSRFSP
jgi:hypothetical protein